MRPYLDPKTSCVAIHPRAGKTASPPRNCSALRSLTPEQGMKERSAPATRERRCKSVGDYALLQETYAIFSLTLRQSPKRPRIGQATTIQRSCLLLDLFLKLVDKLIDLVKFRTIRKQERFKEIAAPLFDSLEPVFADYLALFRSAQRLLESAALPQSAIADLKAARSEMLHARIKVRT